MFWSCEKQTQAHAHTDKHRHADTDIDIDTDTDTDTHTQTHTGTLNVLELRERRLNAAYSDAGREGLLLHHDLLIPQTLDELCHKLNSPVRNREFHQLCKPVKGVSVSPVLCPPHGWPVPQERPIHVFRRRRALDL